MAIATVSEAIERGDISTYLSANNVSNGQLFGARKASDSPILIALVTDALRWGRDGGAQSTQSLREVANYLIWLTGKYGQQAQAIIDGGGGGGTVIPPSNVNVPTPKVIFGTDFSNTTDWVYAPYAGKNLVVFSDGIARYLNYIDEWIYIPTGIRITIPGFDSSLMDYTMVITIIR